MSFSLLAFSNQDIRKFTCNICRLVDELYDCLILDRGGSRTVITSKKEHFAIILNGRKPLTIITKSSILDVTAVLYPSIYVFRIFCNVLHQSDLHKYKFITKKKTLDILRVFSQPFQVLLSEFASFFKKN